MKKTEEKKKIAEDMQSLFLNAKIAIAVDYQGLDANSISNIRKELRNAQIDFKVVKNTLLSKSAANTDFKVLEDFFKGPSAVALSYKDVVSPAKILVEFCKGKEKFKIKAGAMNGKLLDVSAIEALSKLPSKEVLLAQLLSVMNAVPTSFVRVISGVQVNLLNVLNGIKDQKSKQQ